MTALLEFVVVAGGAPAGVDIAIATLTRTGIVRPFHPELLGLSQGYQPGILTFVTMVASLLIARGPSTFGNGCTILGHIGGFFVVDYRSRDHSSHISFVRGIRSFP